MPRQISVDEAQLALENIEHRHQQVVAEIDVPRWYWLGLGAGWVVLGVIADLAGPWLTLAATAIFGAAHASVSGWALSGRHRTGRLSVRGDIAGSRVAVAVICFLLVMVAATVVIALLVDADGADHPATIASVIVGVAVACGGPSLTAAIRRRAAA